MDTNYSFVSAEANLSVNNLLYSSLRNRTDAKEFVNRLFALIKSSGISEEIISEQVLKAPITTGTDPLHLKYLISIADSEWASGLLPHILNAAKDADLELRIDVIQALTPCTKTWNPKSVNDVKQMCNSLSFYTELAASDSLQEFSDMKPVFNEIQRDVTAGLLISFGTNENIQYFLSPSEIANEEFKKMHDSTRNFIGYLRMTNRPLSEKVEESARRFMRLEKQESVDYNVAKVKPAKPALGDQKVDWMERMMDGRPRFGSSEFRTRATLVIDNESSDVAITRLTCSAFDCLSNAILRQHQTKVNLWKIFIINRLPLLFQELLSNIPRSTYEFALRRSLSSINEDTLSMVNSTSNNDIDAMFSTSETGPYDIRIEFLVSMIKLGILGADSVDRILGNSALQEPQISEMQLEINETVERISTDYDCLSSIKNLVADIDTASCVRQGPTITVIVKLISLWASRHETFKLRMLCQEICLNTFLMEIMLIYADVADFISPLTSCLDSWNYDDEENFQDNYTDFGTILLFVTSFYYHFNLQLPELCTKSEDSFCLKYFTTSGNAFPVESLQQENSDLLGGWIMALYDTNGISDELMRTCTPMDYLLLVPTIFQQSVAASNRNILDIDTLKGGLEYFLQPFLLPSVVGALHWLSFHMWTLVDLATPLQILQTLILPPTLSEEAQPLHEIVLRLCSLPVYNIVQEILKKVPSLPVNINFVSIIDVLSPHLQFRKGL
ncbi:mediator complex subunit Med5-domain-containing protein [Dipodascopsis uninucleata]